MPQSVSRKMGMGTIAHEAVDGNLRTGIGINLAGVVTTVARSSRRKLRLPIEMRTVTVTEKMAFTWGGKRLYRIFDGDKCYMFDEKPEGWGKICEGDTVLVQTNGEGDVMPDEPAQFFVAKDLKQLL